MKIVIAGPGAMGCLLGATLVEAGHHVHLLDHDPARAKTLNKRGIIFETSGTVRTVPVDASVDPHVAADADQVWLCVKAYDTARAIAPVASLLPNDVPVVSVQNGIGNVEMIAELMELRRIICASTALGAVSLGPGHIMHAGFGNTVVAPCEPAALDVARAVADTLQMAGLGASAVRDAKSVLWSKVVINAAINPVATLHNIKNGEILTSETALEMARSAAFEAESAVTAAGIKLQYPDAIDEMIRVCGNTLENVCSMLQDIRMRRGTEIDFISGAILKAAKAAGLEAPTNELLLNEIRAIENREPEDHEARR